jgi:predicted aconitase with swiveling domain
MKIFPVIYVSAALLGSAAVWLAAPLARPFMSSLLRKKEPDVADKIDPMLANNRVVAGPEFIPRSAAEDAAAAAGGSRRDTAPEDDPPALLGIFRVTGRETPEWGVLKVRTNFYDTEGKRLGDVPAGLVIDFMESRKSSKGSMVLCKFLHKGREHGPYLVKRADMVLFTGKLTSLSERQRKNLEEYYRTRGLMEERRIAVMQQIAMKNPHYAQYKAAYDKYMEHIDAAKDLAEQRDQATGLTRSNLDDRLRRMKNEEVALKNSYDEIHKKYREWKNANASALPDSATDPQIIEYRREMRTLAERIPGLAS